MHPENIRKILQDPTWKDSLNREQMIEFLAQAWHELLYLHDKRIEKEKLDADEAIFKRNKKRNHYEY